VDGTLIEAWASQQGFRPKDDDPPASGAGRNTATNYRGQKRSNDTHASTTDPDARLARKAKGKEAKLSYSASVLMANRSGLLVDADVRHATGRADVETALAMLERQCSTARRRTLGADKLYDSRVRGRLSRAGRYASSRPGSRRGRSAIDGRTTRHAGYAERQRQRKKVEEGFGWAKTVGLLRKLRHRRLRLVDWVFTFTAAAYNLVRLRTLLATVSP
jgi:hypothetical protein